MSLDPPEIFFQDILFIDIIGLHVHCYLPYMVLYIMTYVVLQYVRKLSLDCHLSHLAYPVAIEIHVFAYGSQYHLLTSECLIIWDLCYHCILVWRSYYYYLAVLLL